MSNTTHNFTAKTNRQLDALYWNYAPGTTAALLHPERSSAIHRAAWAEKVRRTAARAK